MADYDYAGKIAIDLDEPSDVALLPDGRFVVIGDRSNEIAIVSEDGEHERLLLPGLPKKSGLEAVACDVRRGRLFVAAEETHTLARFRIEASKRGVRAVLERTFPMPRVAASKKSRNKGVEGMVFLPAKHSPTKQAQLLLAKEGKPRALALVAADGSGAPRDIALDPNIADVCSDFSCLALDPTTGDVLIGSDESSAAARVKLVGGRSGLRAKLLDEIPLRGKKGRRLERVEGLACNERGELFVLLEDDCVLVRLRPSE